MLAPIALFVYNRPDHLRRTVASLRENDLSEDSELFIFADGPRNESAGASVSGVREFVRTVSGFRRIIIIERPDNLGLANSIIRGVTDLCNEYGRVIVLEDDILLSKGYLSYINAALEKYSATERVMQISGHVFPFKNIIQDNDAYFMPVSTSQGWATWKRAWSLFDPDITGYERLYDDPVFRNKFDLDGNFPYSKMLFSQRDGKIDSWAIRWWWSFCHHDGLCLYPKKSLVYNIGFDREGTHTKEEDSYYNDRNWDVTLHITGLPEEIRIDYRNFAKLKSYLRSRATKKTGCLMWQLLKRITRSYGDR